MMKNTKTVFKIFTIFEHKQEEQFLISMHEKGWKFTDVVFPGFYHFEACAPAKVSYRLDYNPEGKANLAEYVKLFEDCGWNYLFTFFGYSYFCKESDPESADEEIFCDDISRLDMIRHVFKRRLTPLIILFAMVLLPMFLTYTIGNGRGSKTSGFLSVELLIVVLIYLCVFTVSALHCFKYEWRASGERNGVKYKYIAIISLLAAAAVLLCGVYWHTNRSVYEVKDLDNGFTVEAEILNRSVKREFDLKRGDVVTFEEHMDRYVHFEICEKGQDAVFYGDFQLAEPIRYEIQKDGHYQIEVSARKAAGSVLVSVRQ